MTITDPPVITSPEQLPSAWLAYLPVLNGLMRAILAALGAGGWTWAQTVSGSQIEMWGGVLMMLAAAAWSGWERIKEIYKKRQLLIANSRALTSTAAVSASQGVPIVIPPSLPGTTAADLNRAEFARHQGEVR